MEGGTLPLPPSAILLAGPSPLAQLEGERTGALFLLEKPGMCPGALAHLYQLQCLGVLSLGSSYLHGPDMEVQPLSLSLYHLRAGGPTSSSLLLPRPPLALQSTLCGMMELAAPNQCMTEYKYPSSLSPRWANSELLVWAISQQNSIPDAHSSNSLSHPLLPPMLPSRSIRSAS